MSRSLNKVMLIGNVGSEPEIRMTPGGTKVAKVSLATNRTFTDRNGQQQERTDWHRLTFFGRLSDVVEQWVHKGDRLYVEGRIEYSQSTDDSGASRYWTDVIVTEMIMLGASTGTDVTEPPRFGARAPTSPEPEDIAAVDDDLPF